MSHCFNKFLFLRMLAIYINKDLTKIIYILIHNYFYSSYISQNTDFQIPSFEELAERLNYFMHQYNENAQGMQMDLVFFKDAMVHLIKVSSVFSFVLSLTNSNLVE